MIQGRAWYIIRWSYKYRFMFIHMRYYSNSKHNLQRLSWAQYYVIPEIDESLNGHTRQKKSNILPQI